MHPDRNPETFVAATPFGRELGLALVSASEAGCVLRLPYRAEIVGNTDNGALHVGALFSLADSAFGLAVLRKAGAARGFATLDLRIDHLRRSGPGLDVFCEAECYKITRDLAFIRAVLHEGEPAAPLATAVGIFVFTGVSMPDGRRVDGRRGPSA
jgi:uncharacterized protein (TIGR00369 family)